MDAHTLDRSNVLNRINMCTKAHYYLLLPNIRKCRRKKSNLDPLAVLMTRTFRSATNANRSHNRANSHSKGGNIDTREGYVGEFVVESNPEDVTFYHGNMGMPREGQPGYTNENPTLTERREYVKKLIGTDHKFFTTEKAVAEYYARSTAKQRRWPVMETFCMALKLKKRCRFIDIYNEHNIKIFRSLFRNPEHRTVETDNLSKMFEESLKQWFQFKKFRKSIYNDDKIMSNALCKYINMMNIGGDTIHGFCCRTPGHVEYMFCNPRECFKPISDSSIETISVWQVGESLLTREDGWSLVAGVRINPTDSTQSYYYVRLENRLDGPIAKMHHNQIANYRLVSSDTMVLAPSPTICSDKFVAYACNGALPITDERRRQLVEGVPEDDDEAGHDMSRGQTERERSGQRSQLARTHSRSRSRSQSERKASGTTNQFALTRNRSRSRSHSQSERKTSGHRSLSAQTRRRSFGNAGQEGERPTAANDQ
jgi:hypothetical protein